MKKTVFTVALFLCFAVSTALACTQISYHNLICNPRAGSLPFWDWQANVGHANNCPARPYIVDRTIIGGTTAVFDTTPNPFFDPSFGDPCLPVYLARADRAWMPIGPDPKDPWLEPHLMKHSIYADLRIRADNALPFPPAGYTGTAGTIELSRVSISGTDPCDTMPKSFIQTLGQSASVDVGSGRNLQWGGLAGNNFGWGTAPTGTGTITQVPVVYPVRPRFPDIRYNSFWQQHAPNLKSLILETGQTVRLSQGVHFFDFIAMNPHSILEIEVGGPEEKTIIYLRGTNNGTQGIRVLPGNQAGPVRIRTVDRHGVPVPAQTPGVCKPTHGQALIISRGCIQNTTGETHVFEIAASIITLGGINITGGSEITGQILADVVTTNANMTAAAAIRNTVFRPVRIYQIDVPPATFGEDRFWAWRSSGCDFTGAAATPRYFDKITHGLQAIGANEITKEQAVVLNSGRNYYDTVIVVKPSEPIAGGFVEIEWKVRHQAGIVEPFTSRQGGNTRVLVDGALSNGYITGKMIFTKNIPEDTIRLRIFDHEKGVDRTDTIFFEKLRVSEENHLSDNLMPTTITIKSDNDCTPEEEKCPPHEWGDWETTKTANCLEEGSERQVCKLCGHIETRPIPKLPADDERCKCDHEFGDWETTKTASCLEEGSERQVCKLCGHTETRPIPKIDCPPVIDLFTPNSIIEFNNCNESAGQVVGTLSSSNQTGSKFVLTDDLGGWFEVDENTGVITTTDTYRGLSTQSPVIIKAKAVLTTILGELESEEITISIEITPWAQTFSFEQTGRIIEYFDGGQNSGQVAGTLLRARSVITNQQFPGWFAIDGNNRIVTTDAYRADYELGQNKINISVKNDCIDKDTTITIAISPWNDNPFDPQEDFAVVDIDKGNVIMIDVLANDNHDKDLPQSANRQKIIGLTLGEEISPARRIPVGEPRPVHSRSIITSLNAVVTIRNDSIMYDISGNGNINGGERDVFYYTALDTAIYTDHLGNSYQTDVWVKSVRVTVDIRRKKFDFYVFPQPLNLSNNNLNRFDGFVDCYNTNDVRNKNGVTIIFEAKGSPITNLSEQKGSVMIFDQLGNLVRERIEMEFINIICGDEKDGVVGVAVWDAKNRNKRTVAPGAYMALVEVDVTFDDGHREVRPYRSPIMIITAPERK